MLDSEAIGINYGQAAELDAPSVGSESQPAPVTAGEQPTNDAAPSIQEPTPSAPAPAAPAPADQAAYQQWLQERQAYQAQLAQAQQREAQMREVLWQVKLAQTPEDQRAALIEERRQQEFSEQRQNLQQERTAFFRSVEPIMKEVVIGQLLDQYRYAGVTKEELMGFSNPDDAERYAQGMARRHRAAQAQKAQPAAQVAQAQGAPAPKSWKTMTVREQLSAALAQM